MKAPIKLSLGSEQRESEASKKERQTNGEKLLFSALISTVNIDKYELCNFSCNQLT